MNEREATERARPIGEQADAAARRTGETTGASGLGGAIRGHRSGRPALDPRSVRRLQRLAGNRSTGGLIRGSVARSSRPDTPPVVQRDDTVPAADVSVKAVKLSASKVTIPLTGTLTASAVPPNATGVKFSVEKQSVEPTDVTIDATSGAITIGAGQQGGAIEVMAEAADGSKAWAPLQIIEQPNGVASTSASGARDYGGTFVHTFSAPSGASSALEGANLNEKFASRTARPPWGGRFQLEANRAGSHGWDLDAAGTMTGPDTVDIESRSVDVGRFVESASNPTPKGSLPQGFTMTQKLFAKLFPSGRRSSSPATTIDHTRTLVAGPKFEVTAGLDTTSEDYTGPAAVTGAAASSTTVMASSPESVDGAGEQRTVTVTADPIPTDAPLTFSIVGRARGCTVDQDGTVTIGRTPGTIRVRVSASRRNYDEVEITITKYVAPSADIPSATEPSLPDDASDQDDLDET